MPHQNDRNKHILKTPILWELRRDTWHHPVNPLYSSPWLPSLNWFMYFATTMERRCRQPSLEATSIFKPLEEFHRSVAGAGVEMQYGFEPHQERLLPMPPRQARTFRLIIRFRVIGGNSTWGRISWLWRLQNCKVQSLRNRCKTPKKSNYRAFPSAGFASVVPRWREPLRFGQALLKRFSDTWKLKCQRHFGRIWFRVAPGDVNPPCWKSMWLQQAWHCAICSAFVRWDLVQLEHFYCPCCRLWRPNYVRVELAFVDNAFPTRWSFAPLANVQQNAIKWHRQSWEIRASDVFAYTSRKQPLSNLQTWLWV